MSKEKTYYEHLDEISAENLFEGLLGYGMFAERIPNFLSSKKFYDLYSKEKGKMESGISPKNTICQHIVYEGTRETGTPRCFAIPNPMAYYYQCKVLSKNWENLKSYFQKKTCDDTHKISRIHVKNFSGKKYLISNNDYDTREMDTIEPAPMTVGGKIFEMNHRDQSDKNNPERELRIGMKYKIKADISACFPSIYTHAIPWAIMGKGSAKKDKKNHYANSIDKATQKMNYNETMGIFIGPHSSNIVSEIILVAIDRDLQNLQVNKYRYIRHIDDYVCYTSSRDEAERFLIDLAKCLKQYGLSLNHKKTKISELPLTYEEEWVSQLKLFKMDEYQEQIKYPSIVAFLDKSIALIKQNDNKTSILKYAIKMLNGRKMTENAERYYFDTLHHLVLLYPYLIPCIETVFDNQNYQIQLEQIEKISKDIFKMGKTNNNHEACSYAIYFSLKYEFLFRENIHDFIRESNDCILMLLGYLRAKKDSEKSEIETYVKKAKGMIQTSKLDDNFWLFAYEILNKEEKQGLKNCKGWDYLSEQNISFIKDEFLN